MTGAYFHEQEADDTALIGLRFANGRIGQVASVGYRNGAVTFAMDLVCESGTIRIDFDHGVSHGPRRDMDARSPIPSSRTGWARPWHANGAPSPPAS